MSLIPNTNQPGLVVTSVGDGLNTVRFGGANFPTVTASYGITGAIAVASGATNYITPFPVILLNNEVVYLVQIYAWLRSGSAVFSINHNGSAITGLSAITVTTTPTAFLPTANVLVASTDYFAPVVSSVSSTPDGLSMGFVFTQVI